MSFTSGNVGTVAALNSEHGQVWVAVVVNDQVTASTIGLPATSDTLTEVV